MSMTSPAAPQRCLAHLPWIRPGEPNAIRRITCRSETTGTPSCLLSHANDKAGTGHFGFSCAGRHLPGEPRSAKPTAHLTAAGQGLRPRRGYPRSSSTALRADRVMPLPRLAPPPARLRAVDGSRRGPVVTASERRRSTMSSKPTRTAYVIIDAKEGSDKKSAADRSRRRLVTQRWQRI